MARHPKETGRRLAKFGPVTSWTIDLSKAGAQVTRSSLPEHASIVHIWSTVFRGQLSLDQDLPASPLHCQMRATQRPCLNNTGPVTADQCEHRGGTVRCLKTVGSVTKNLSQHLAEAAEVAAVCYAALAAPEGGASDASLSEVVAKLSRAKVRLLGRSASRAGICMHGVVLQPAPWELCCCRAGIAGDGPLSAECRRSRLKPLAAWPTLLAAQVGQELRLGKGGVAAEPQSLWRPSWGRSRGSTLTLPPPPSSTPSSPRSLFQTTSPAMAC